MFEKLRIKEHMEIVDANGRHVGTVDEHDGDFIKLTRSDSGDGHHHRIPFDDVDRIADNRVYLKDGAVIPAAGVQQQHAAGTQPQWQGGTVSDAQAASITPSTGTGTTTDTPLFGTSGHGTGMGGSGIGN